MRAHVIHSLSCIVRHRSSVVTDEVVVCAELSALPFNRQFVSPLQLALAQLTGIDAHTIRLEMTGRTQQPPAGGGPAADGAAARLRLEVSE